MNKDEQIIENAESMIEKREVKAKFKGTAYLDRIDYLVEKYRASIFFILFQMVIILFLTIGYLSVKDNTIVEVRIPKIVKDTDFGELKIGMKASNDLYYKVWGRYIVFTTTNTTPDNIRTAFNDFYEMLHPNIEKQYRTAFDKFVQTSIENKTTSEFKTIKYTIDNNDDSATYTAEGILKLHIDGLQEEKYSCKYIVGFHMINYMLFIDKYKKKCELLNKKRVFSDSAEPLLDSMPKKEN